MMMMSFFDTRGLKNDDQDRSRRSAERGVECKSFTFITLIINTSIDVRDCVSPAPSARRLPAEGRRRSHPPSLVRSSGGAEPNHHHSSLITHHHPPSSPSSPRLLHYTVLFLFFFSLSSGLVHTTPLVPTMRVQVRMSRAITGTTPRPTAISNNINRCIIAPAQNSIVLNSLSTSSRIQKK